jgi:hypothetical protein
MAATPNLPIALPYHPTTFIERGVAVPFTTPLLCGTRARPAERGGAELIVPNPSRSRGVYVLPWSGVRELCRPTVHDSRLNEKVASLRSVTPATLRKAAREVAAEGLAGREALGAAEAATEADEHARLLTNFLLVMALVEQLNMAGADEEPPPRTEVMAERAQQAVATIAPRLGRPPEAVAARLEELAHIFAPVGVGRHAAEARVALSIAELGRLRADMLAWTEEVGGESGALATIVGQAAEVAITCAQRTAQEALALTRNVPDLLRRLESAPDPVARLAARPEWLLDGWEQITGVWRSAGDEIARRVALAEIALLVPVIPKEASDWVGTQVDGEGPMRFRRTVTRNEDWRTGGTALDRIARNEQLRALAA